jgi:very-short-patch-repair endonuclease
LEKRAGDMNNAQSKAQLARFRDPKERRKCGRAFRGKKRPEHSRAMKRAWRSGAYEDRFFSKKVRRSMALRLAEARKDPKALRKAAKGLSRSMKERMKNPEYVQYVLQSHKQISKPQRSVFCQLSRAGIRGHRLEYPVGRYSVDIAFPKLWLAVEIDGHYWHSLNRNRDRRKTRYLRRNGWEVLRFPARKSSGLLLLEVLYRKQK